MAGGRLEALGLLKREITPRLSADLKGWVLLFCKGIIGRVVSRARLLGLLFALRAIRRLGAHRV